MQWKSLTLGEPPSGSWLTPVPGKYEDNIPSNRAQFQEESKKPWPPAKYFPCQQLFFPRPSIVFRVDLSTLFQSIGKVYPRQTYHILYNRGNFSFAVSFFLTLQKKVYSTMYSQAVTHPSTNMAQCCLTSVIGRELVHSTWYGRRQNKVVSFGHMMEQLTFWTWTKVYSTVYSQAVTHPSTNTAQCCLTSVIGRELVHSTWYGRRQEKSVNFGYFNKTVGMCVLLKHFNFDK